MSILSADIDDELFKKIGLKGLSQDFDRILVEKHPSLAKNNLKVADFFNSKQNKASHTNQEIDIMIGETSKENVHENLKWSITPTPV